MVKKLVLIMMFLSLLFASTAFAANWTWTNPLPQGNSLYGITTDGSSFLAAGGRGITVNSADGTTWSAVPKEISDDHYGVAYGDGTYVAIGSSGKIYTSSDGTTWTSRTSGTSSILKGVVYGNGLFVAVGASGKILTSSDYGVTWTSQLSGVTTQLNGIAYSGTAYAAVGAGGKILTSSNAVDWTSQTSGTTNDLLSVSYGTSYFVAGGASGTILKSSDNTGSSWSSGTSGITNSIYGVGCGNGLFVAVGSSGKIIVSSNGTTWTSKTSGTSEQLNGITYASNNFVVIGQAGQILTSLDGNAWASRRTQLYDVSGITGQGAGFGSLAYGNNILVSVGLSGKILTSSDGVTWTTRASGTSQSLFEVRFLNNTFFAVGNNGTILTSSNGIDWTSQTSGTTASLRDITYGNNTFVAVAPTLTSVMIVSPDGVNWTVNPNFTYANANAIAFGDNMFVATGSSGLVYTSTDLVNWTSRATGGNQTLSFLKYCNNLFLGGSYGNITRSANGINWTNITRGSQSLYDISCGNNMFVGGGAGGAIVYSYDASTWATEYAIETGPNENGVAYGNGNFVIVGDRNLIGNPPAQTNFPNMVVTPSSNNFGGVTVDTTSQSQAFTVSNTGTGNLVINLIGLEGSDAVHFSQTNNCTTVTPGGSCTITATFTPTSTGAKSAAIVIYSNDPTDNSLCVPVNGTGTAAEPDISASPTSLNFGNVTVNTTSTSQTVTVTNVGTANLSISAVTLTGTNSSEYTKQVDTCSGNTLPPSENCNIQIAFMPTSAGAKTAGLAITSNDPDTPELNIPLSGTGIQQSIQSEVEVVLSCQTNVTAGNALTVTVKLYNYDCASSISVNRLMMQLMGNSSGTLFGLGIWGPYNKWITAKTVSVATCDEFGNVTTPGTVLPFSITIINPVPTSLSGKMAEVTVDAITSKGESIGSGSCFVNVTGAQ